jgi:peptide/nickel transport system substrate-binding protein
MNQFRWLLLTIVALTACAPAAPATPTGGAAPAATAGPKRSETQVIRAASAGLPTSASPESSSVNVEQFWAQFDNLVRFDEKFTVLPSAAERWEMIPGKDGWRFTIRKDLVFSNGDKLTAADVDFTIKNAFERRLTITGPLSRVTGSEVVDDYTVDIVTRGPDISMLHAAPRLMILPKKYYEQVGRETFATKPIGSGPYELIEYRPSDSMIYRLRQGYTHPLRKPIATEIRWKAVPVSSQLLNGLRVGEIDLAYGGVSTEHVAAALREGAQIIDAPGGGSNIVLTLDRPFLEKNASPLLDKRVRLAMNYAIDRDAIGKTVFNGLGKPVYQIATPNILMNDNGIAPLPFDQAKAKALLAEAGYPNGFKLVNKLDFWARENWPDAMLALQGYWKQVGIEVELSPLEQGAWVDVALKRNGRAPGELFMATLGDSSAVFVSGNNYTCMGDARWCVPEFDRNLALAHAEPDAAKRTGYLRAANRAYSAEWHMFPIIFVPNPVLASQKLKDVKVITHWVTNFDTAYKVD